MSHIELYIIYVNTHAHTKRKNKRKTRERKKEKSHWGLSFAMLPEWLTILTYKKCKFMCVSLFCLFSTYFQVQKTTMGYYCALKYCIVWVIFVVHWLMQKVRSNVGQPHVMWVSKIAFFIIGKNPNRIEKIAINMDFIQNSTGILLSSIGFVSIGFDWRSYRIVLFIRESESNFDSIHKNQSIGSCKGSILNCLPPSLSLHFNLFLWYCFSFSVDSKISDEFKFSNKSTTSPWIFESLPSACAETMSEIVQQW